jgi:hypothetical protein
MTTLDFFAGDELVAADLQLLANLTVNRPYCKVVQQVAQNLANNTDTLITFGTGSEVEDTNGMHNESSDTSRLVVPDGYDGWWKVNGTLFMAAAGSGVTYVNLQSSIYLSGSVQIPRNRVGFGPNQSNVSATSMIVMEVEATAGQYFELVASQIASTTGTKATSAGGSFASVFSAEFLRPSA